MCKRVGITLIELAVTLAIVAILAVMVLPNLGTWIQHYRIKGAVRQIVSQMELAKIKALKYNREYRLRINTNSGTFQLEQGNRPDMSSNWGGEEPELTLPKHVSFDTVTFPQTELGQDHDRAVQFNPHGTSGHGRVVLATTRDEKYTITVRNPTGKITTYKGEIE